MKSADSTDDRINMKFFPVRRKRKNFKKIQQKLKTPIIHDKFDDVDSGSPLILKDKLLNGSGVNAINGGNDDSQIFDVQNKAINSSLLVEILKVISE